jgi:Family of unknown function (DUF6801)
MRMRTAGWPVQMRHAVKRPTPRGAVSAVAVAVVLVAAGVSAGSAAAGQQAVSLRLGYTCAFPSALRPVSALVTTTFPAAGTAGQPIQPTGTSIAVTLPHTAIADVAGQSAAMVTLTASLRTNVTERTRQAAAIWRGFRSPATVISRNGPLTLTASGSAPPVTARTAGEITVTTGGLSLLFTARAANGGPPGPSSTPASPSSTPASPSSSPAAPSSGQVACLLDPGQDTALARIAVAGPAPAKPPASHNSAADNPAKCLPFPKNLKLNPRFPLPKPLPGSHFIHAPQKACAYSTGFTNAQKLNEAALVGPGLTDLLLGLKEYTKFTSKYAFIQNEAAGQFEYHGQPVLPPARATLLGFGFVPVTATIQISEIGSLNVALISCTPANKCPNPPPKSVALFFGLVSLRISNVDVNGVPLNVGTHCQTATPFSLELMGTPPSYSVLNIKGVLTGTVTVPKFSGCMNGTEDLDPLFDATVSGPGNFVKVTQGTLCSPEVGSGCPPPKPIPKH